MSRVDTEVDNRIQTRGGSLAQLQGKAGLAGARLAYETFTEMRRTPRWQALETKGAQLQRLLWASTGTKNPRYSDVVYVESLIGPDTITTVPPDTLRRFEDHGRIANVLGSGTADVARGVMDALASGGIDFTDVNRTLEEEGIAEVRHIVRQAARRDRSQATRDISPFVVKSRGFILNRQTLPVDSVPRFFRVTPGNGHGPLGAMPWGSWRGVERSRLKPQGEGDEGPARIRWF